MFSFMRAFGQSFGVAIGGVVFQNALIKQFAKYPGLDSLAGQYAKDAVALVELIKVMPKGNPIRADLVQAYADAIRMVWIAMVAFAAVGLLTSIGTEGLSLDRVLMTDQGLRDEKKKPQEMGDA
jgi:hypothetical protein